MRGICKSDIGYLGTIYIVYTFAVNRHLDLQMVNLYFSENWFPW